MAQVGTGDPDYYEVHFLNSENPRDGFCVMSMTPPTYYDFRTIIGFGGGTHTNVRAVPPLPSDELRLTSQTIHDITNLHTTR
jgi:hypothetical protein